MDLFVDVQCIVFAQVLQHHAGDVFLQAVAPLHQQGVTLQASRAGRVGVARQRKLVGIAAEPGISDLGRALVRRLRGEDEAEEESYDEQKPTLHCAYSLKLQM